MRHCYSFFVTLRQKFISTFIIFNVLAILIAPVKTVKDQNLIQKPFYYYALWTRLLQRWNLFAPDPRKDATYYRVEVTFNDFSQYMWRRPYPTNWGFFYRHLCYNWQKYDLAVTHMEYPQFWDDIVNFIAHQDFITKPIKRIRLSKMKSPWPPPKLEGYAFTEVKDLIWQDVTVFVYDFENKKYL